MTAASIAALPDARGSATAIWRAVRWEYCSAPLRTWRVSAMCTSPDSWSILRWWVTVPFPETAEQLAGLLRRRLAEGAYDVDDAEELAGLVTADLQSVNGDRHLRLKHHAALDAMRRDFDSSLGGAPRVQLLDGGVAVVELAPMLFPLEWAAEPLGAALTLASRAQALIVDLRGNRGGDPDTVAFVCSYLLDERTHLNTMHWRGGERSEQSWSLPHVPGARFGGSKPLYVLSSDSTFSAAEELAYDIQQLIH
ncbi:S41 family peptidase [Streptomyces sp. NPDC005122]